MSSLKPVHSSLPQLKAKVRNLSIETLRTFVTVVDLGGHYKAGEALNLSQPAVSLQIKKLEQQLDCKLFKRQGQRQVLNDKGVELLQLARQMLKLNDNIFRHFYTEPLTGSIKLGIPTEFAAHLMPRMLGEFVKRYPDVSLEVATELSSQLKDEQINQGYDLILALAEEDENLRQAPFLYDEMVWVGNLDALDGREVNLVVAPEGCIYRRRAIRALEQAGLNWRVSYCNDDLTGILSALNAGLGISVLISKAVPADTQFARSNKLLPPLGRVGLSLNQTSPGRSDAVDTLYEFIRERFYSL